MVCSFEKRGHVTIAKQRFLCQTKLTKAGLEESNGNTIDTGVHTLNHVCFSLFHISHVKTGEIGLNEKKGVVM